MLFFIWTSLASALFFVAWAMLCSVEKILSKRLILPRLRNWLDLQLQSIIGFFASWSRYIARYFVTLGWYYSIHALLKACLRFVANIYFVLEHMFERNRQRTKQLRREQRQQNPFFLELTEHKSNTTLSKGKQQALKKRALEGK